MSTRRLLVLSALLLSGSLAISADAFREPEQRVEFVPEGAEWIAGHGDTLTQSHVIGLPAGFEARHGSAWTHRLGGPNGLFHHFWGEGIEVDPAAGDDPAVAQAVADAFWQANADLLPEGVAVDDLVPWSNVLSRGVRYVSHHQTVAGTPVLRASTFVAIRDGRVFWFGVRCFPVEAVANQALLDPERAAETAAGALRDLGHGAVVEGTPELAVMPLIGADALDLRLVYTVALDGLRMGHWTAYVDAQEDVLLALRDDRLFMTGSVALEHYPRNPGDPATTTSPASHLWATTGDGQTTLDANGAYTAGGNTTSLDLQIRGDYFNVDNEAGSDLAWTVGTVGDGDQTVWTGGGVEFDEAQIHGYRYAEEVRTFAKGIAPSLGALDDSMQVNVNYNDNCNAWYDGDITFLQAGQGCNNTGMVADVVYHEYGHGFHFQSIIWGVGDFYGDVGEGFADAMAFQLTHDHVMAPYFMTSGGGIRDLEPDHVYPDDVVGEVHYDGIIVGGALWDLRKIFVADMGEPTAVQVLGEIYAGMTQIATDIPSTYEAALVADDDNANLADGTPHVCEIDAAFGPHGLVAGGMGALLIDHEPITAAAEDEPIPIAVTVGAVHPECAEASIGDVRLVYSTDGSNWNSVVLDDLGGEQYEGEIPGSQWGTQVRYRIEADDNETNTTIQRPRNPADPAYYVYVGEIEEILCDDFEGGEGDWTHELIEGEQTEGADDWMLGAPVGKGGDPDGCYSGSGCWGNDLALESNWDGMYQNNRINTLRSPAYDLSGYDTVRLQLRRWLQVEDAVYDHGKIYVNDVEVWDNAEGPGDVHHQDYEWVLFDLDITDEAAGQDEVEIRFEIQSDQGLQFGGWNIDDFCLYTMTEGSPGDDDSGDDDDATDDDDSGDDDAADDDDDVVIGDTCECRVDGGRAPWAGLATLAAFLAALGLRRRIL